jgi:hypothetical protein
MSEKQQIVYQCQLHLFDRCLGLGSPSPHVMNNGVLVLEALHAVAPISLD